MPLPVIRREELPKALRDKPQTGEVVHYFSYIADKGGCGKPEQVKQWMLVTNKRIMFEASVKESSASDANFSHQNGTIPMAKVSYVACSEVSVKKWWGPVKATHLIINSSGGQIVLEIPTLVEGQRAQEVIDGVISNI